MQYAKKESHRTVAQLDQTVSCYFMFKIDEYINIYTFFTLILPKC